MGLILAIETATEICSVALGRDGSVLAERNNVAGNVHASLLHIMIADLMRECGYTLKELDAIAVGKGPGSYTGLRVGVASAKGLAYALQVPLIGVGTLPAMTCKLLAHVSHTDALFVPMIDARRMEVFTSIYNEHFEEMDPVQAKIIDEHSFRERLDKGKLFFFGNGSEKCKEVIHHPNAWFLDGFQNGASGLIPLAEKAYEKQHFENLAYFEPYYLKEFVGTTPKIRK